MTTRDTDSLSATQEALAAHATDAWDVEQQADCAPRYANTRRSTPTAARCRTC